MVMPLLPATLGVIDTVDVISTCDLVIMRYAAMPWAIAACTLPGTTSRSVYVGRLNDAPTLKVSVVETDTSGHVVPLPSTHAPSPAGSRPNDDAAALTAGPTTICSELTTTVVCPVHESRTTPASEPCTRLSSRGMVTRIS